MNKTFDTLQADYLSVLHTQSKSGDCDAMMAEIVRQLDQIPGVTHHTDDYGNLYAVKGRADTFPVFVCHTDTVHPIHDTFSIFRTASGHYFAMSEDGGDLKQVGIGGDDKCGIIACLELLHRLKRVKCAFFLDEETGCKGSRSGDLSFFDDARFAIQIDRRNGGDIITSGAGTELCSDDFKRLISSVGEIYGFSPTTGLNTDVVALKERGMNVSAVNLSCGYYNPHSKAEYIVESELMNTINFCTAMGRFTSVFRHEYRRPAPAPTASRVSGSRDVGKYLPAPTGVPRCLECDSPLAWAERDQRVCDDCTAVFVREAYQHYLVEDADGQLVLTNEPDAPALDVTPATPDECAICASPLAEAGERERGYCEACRHCGYCQAPIDSAEGLRASLCAACLQFIGEDRECATDHCAEGAVPGETHCEKHVGV